MSPEDHGPDARRAPEAGGDSGWAPPTGPNLRWRDEPAEDAAPEPARSLSTRVQRAFRPAPARGRRVRRTVRHVEPWSVLKISLLFFSALFLIVCVASALLWTVARASGTLDDLERSITSYGAFGDCVPIDGEEPETEPEVSTTVPEGVDQVESETGATTLPDEDVTEVDEPENIDEDEDCPEGQHLVGAFEFRDGRILQAFAFGGVVLVLAGTGAAVVLVLLFNLMSDLTGGVQVTVYEDEPGRRSGSPRPRRRG